MLSNLSRSLRLRITPFGGYLKLNNFIFRSFGAKVKEYSGSDREVDKTKKPANLKPSGTASDSERRTPNKPSETQTNSQQGTKPDSTKSGLNNSNNVNPSSNTASRSVGTADLKSQNPETIPNNTTVNKPTSSSTGLSGSSSSSNSSSQEGGKVKVIETVANHRVKIFIKNSPQFQKTLSQEDMLRHFLLQLPKKRIFIKYMKT